MRGRFVEQAPHVGRPGGVRDVVAGEVAVGSKWLRDRHFHLRQSGFNTVIRATQINGGFYSPSGIALAAANSAVVLSAERSPLEMML